MARQIVLGNGKIILALDNKLSVRDLFYPQVGLENHLAGHLFRLGIWSEGIFKWSDQWQVEMKYLPQAMVTKNTARSDDLQVELELNEAVHHSHNIFLRRIVIHNLRNVKRTVKVFFCHDFHIYGSDSGDTAMFDPSTNSLIHYKRRRYFLINGITDQNNGIYQFATGTKESLGREGTWKDAEDGELQGNPIAQGSVDSTVSFKLEMLPESSNTIYYWLTCGRNIAEVKELDTKVKNAGVEQLLLETENYWSAWVNKQEVDLSTLPRNIRSLFNTSLMIMRTHVDAGGAIIASCDSDALKFNRDTYDYVWPRDGALTVLAFDSAGFQEVSRLFFGFCHKCIASEGYFQHKYTSDGSRGSSWQALVDPKGNLQLPIQEDETALVLFALWKHYQKFRNLEFIADVYPELVVKTSEFLLEHRDEATGLPKPSFDLWEEKFGVFTATTATTCAALEAAANFAKVFFDSKRQDRLNKCATRMKQAIIDYLYDKKLGRFIKAIYPDGTRDATIDSSLAFLFLYGPFDPGEEMVVNTMKSLINTLGIKTEIGGFARYENDEYYRISKDVPGNTWFLCTLWVARWYIATANSVGDLKKAMDLIIWTAKHSLSSGILSEQINPYTGAPISVSPLVWSHTEFVTTVCEYLDKYKLLRSGKIKY
jgi:GH15 family glucan-1,4-alpha-glucosidase